MKRAGSLVHVLVPLVSAFLQAGVAFAGPSRHGDNKKNRCERATEPTRLPAARKHLPLRSLLERSPRINARNCGAYSCPMLQKNIAHFGLDKFADLEIMASYGIFEDASTVLDIGAGGAARELGWLLSHYPRSHVIAVEHAPEAQAILENGFGNNSNVTLVPASFLDAGNFTSMFPDKFKQIVFGENTIEVAVCPFTTLFEFGLSEQKHLLDLVYWLLKPGGTLVIDIADPDTVDPNKLPQHAVLDGNLLTLRIIEEGRPATTLALYLSSIEEVRALATASGFRIQWIHPFEVLKPGVNPGQGFRRISIGLRKSAS